MCARCRRAYVCVPVEDVCGSAGVERWRHGLHARGAGLAPSSPTPWRVCAHGCMRVCVPVWACVCSGTGGRARHGPPSTPPSLTPPLSFPIVCVACVHLSPFLLPGCAPVCVCGPCSSSSLPLLPLSPPSFLLALSLPSSDRVLVRNHVSVEALLAPSA